MSTAGAGRVALVSGGNRGIGLAIVRGLAQAGMTVFMGARDLAEGVRAAGVACDPADGARAAGVARDPANAAPAAGLPGEVRVVELDVSEPDSIGRAIAAVEGHAGRLHVLVNNAGIYPDEGTRAVDPDFALIERTLQVNLLGAWRLSVACLPLLRRARGAQIVSVSSGMGQLDDMGGGAPGYRLSKVGLSVMTRTFTAELRGAQVAVNVVCPGWVRTEMGGPHATRSPEQGADTVVWLATLPRDELPTGSFLRDRRPIPW